MQVPGHTIRSPRPSWLPTQRLDDLGRVRRRADDVAHRLHLGAAVDVRQHLRVRVLVLERLECVGWTAVGERAARLEIGHHDDPIGVQDLRSLGHEVDAAERDHVAVDLRGGLGERERVAHEVGEVLDLGLLVVVREQDRVALFLELEDRGLEILGNLLSAFRDGGRLGHVLR
jgi:hypothetical protein